MKKNIVLFTKQFEGHIPFINGKFRYYIDTPMKECEGGRATILPTSERIKAHGGIEHVTMAYGYGIKIKKDSKGYYYEFASLHTDSLVNYFRHTGNRYVDKNIEPFGPAVGFRYQYESNFISKIKK